MSRRRKIALSVVGIVVLLVGAASIWKGGETDSRPARVLLLDPRTGETLHEHTVPGGYAIADLLSGGRVAVASENGCPDSRGGWITVLDASLQHVLSERPVDPCMVARLNRGDLRARFKEARGRLPDYHGARDVTVNFEGGKIVQYYATTDTGTALAGMTAYDAAGRALWERHSLGRIGVVDVRDGRVVVPVLGTFTPGSD